MQSSPSCHLLPQYVFLSTLVVNILCGTSFNAILSVLVNFLLDSCIFPSAFTQHCFLGAKLKDLRQSITTEKVIA
jgi:hypothetical protein